MQTSHMRAAHLEVDLGQLRQNLLNIQKHVQPAKVMVLLKANAYGHGADGIAPYFAPLVDYMGVAFVGEAVYLRTLGIQTPIIVLSGTLHEELPQFLEHNLTLAVSSKELLEAAENMAAAANRRLRVHLKIDTGMERTGVHDYDAESFLEKSLSCRHLEIEGIYTHFANSEASDLADTSLQLDRFSEVLSFYDRRGVPRPALRHAANSGGILQLPESHLDMVRAGIMFYGIYPGPEVRRTVLVSPALRWVARVVHSKITLPGRPVSYGSLWSPTQPARIVTIPCGYGDGYFRRMSNRAHVIISGRRYEQVGRICMDQFMVNGQEDEIRVGDEALLLGSDRAGMKIGVEDLAEWAGTSEYEVLTSISSRVPRVYIGG